MTFRAIAIACLLTASSLQAREVYQLGGVSGQSWEESGSMSFIDTESTAGAILPFATESTHNLVSSMESRGGSLFSIFDTYTLPQDWVDGGGTAIVDGDSTTAFVHPPRIKILGGGGGFWTVPFVFDLGAPFQVERIRFMTRPDHPENQMRIYVLSFNDGSGGDLPSFSGNVDETDGLGNRIWTKYREEIDNLEGVVDLEIDPQMVRFVYLLPGTDPFRGGLSETWELAEMQIFGRGFVPNADFVSDPIDLGDVASLGQIRWSWTVDPGAQIVIQTRSGSDDQPNVYWRKTGVGNEISSLDDFGVPLDADDYALLRPDKRAGVTDDLTNWSPWQTYDLEDGQEGTQILSPSPRRYVQTRVLFSTAGLAGGRVDSLRFDYSRPPVVRSAIGEITPTLVEAAEPTPFTYSVRSRIDAGQSGFDALRLSTAAQIDAISEVRIDRAPVEYTESTLQDGSRLIGFPRVRQDQTLLEVDLQARVFRYGTPFAGSVLDSEADEVPLRISPGDAVAEVSSDELDVRIRFEDKLLTDLAVSSNPFTPNGDGINDEMRLSFSLLRLTEATPVTLSIHDLAGRLIRRIDADLQGSQALQMTWDGRDTAGDHAPPGQYIYRLSIESDGGTQERIGQIAVAY